MTVVIADTSPLNYLVLIDQIHLLPQLYGSVLIPPEVAAELTDSGTPPPVSAWFGSGPIWLLIRPAPETIHDPTLDHLDAGERASILLAQSESDVLLLIDEALGRAEASRREIRNTGTLGVLRDAAVRNLVDLPSALARLTETNFRVSPLLIAELLAEDAQRRRR